MSERSNRDWLKELRGDCGRTIQKLAHQDLASYLYQVVYNYLEYRQAEANSYILVNSVSPKLAIFAQERVQEMLKQMACNDFALLEQFKDEGPFTSWVALLVCNQVAQKLPNSMFGVSYQNNVYLDSEYSERSLAFEPSVV